jgi:hypothetical protein
MLESMASSQYFRHSSFATCVTSSRDRKCLHAAPFPFTIFVCSFVRSVTVSSSAVSRWSCGTWKGVHSALCPMIWMSIMSQGKVRANSAPGLAIRCNSLIETRRLRSLESAISVSSD